MFMLEPGCNDMVSRVYIFFLRLVRLYGLSFLLPFDLGVIGKLNPHGTGTLNLLQKGP